MNKSSKRQMLLSADLTTFLLSYIPLGEEWKQLRGQQYWVRFRQKVWLIEYTIKIPVKIIK